MAEHERDAIVTLLEHVLAEAHAGRVTKLLTGWIDDTNATNVVCSNMLYVEKLGLCEVIKADAVAKKEGRDVNGT